MCSPNLIVAGVSLAATAAQAAGQSSNQKAMLAHENEVTRRTEENALKARAADERALAQRVKQAQQSVALELKLDRIRADEQMSGVVVSAEASGVGQGGLYDLANTLGIKAGENAAVRMRNLSWEEQQVMRSMDKVAANYENRLNQRYLPGIPGVDFASLLAGVAGAANAYYTTPDSFDKIKKP